MKSMHVNLQKDDYVYYGELLAELQQLDSLIALNKSNMFGGSSQFIVNQAREILIREIFSVENLISDKILSSNTESLISNLCLCKCNFHEKDTLSNKFEKMLKISIDNAQSNTKKSEIFTELKDERRNSINGNRVALRKRVSNNKPLNNESELVNNQTDVFNVIVEKVALNGNYKMYCKLKLPENVDSSYNMIGRILGPRGISIRQMEARFSCKILIRGKGSFKNAEDEQRLRNTLAGKHLNEKLHVLIEIEKPDRELCLKKINAAKTFIEQLLTKPEFDNFKRNQLIQLAIINGTYRKSSSSPRNKKNISSTKSS